MSNQTVTKDIAVNSRGGQIFHHITEKNADKTPMRCRVNGKCKTWKTRPMEFKLPVKHGLRNCFYLSQDNAGDWVTIS